MYAPNAHLKKTQTQLDYQAAPSMNETDCEFVESVGSSGILWKFDQELVRRALAHMIIVDELPFKIVEREGFRHFCSVGMNEFRIPSRTTITRDCLKLYIEEKMKLKQYFRKTAQRVSITIHSRTSINQVNFMVLTAHYIDDNWKLIKKILNFVPIESHKGEAIGLAVKSCLLDWGLDKVFTITVDNATSNDVAISYLKNQLKNWGNRVCDGKYLHVRCIAHILNLVVCDGLQDLKIEIARVRACVRWIRHSPSRIKKFKECVEFEKIEKNSSLILDVPTRWNSTYLMLNVAQFFERAFNRMGSRNPLFKKEMEGDKGWPTAEDWANVRRIVTFLEVFYETTLRVSGTLYVTSSIFFQEIVDIEDYLRDENEEDCGMVQMTKRMRNKYDKYWGGGADKMNKLLLLAIVFDPRHKMLFIEYGFGLMYGKGSPMANLMISDVKEALLELFTFYNAKHTSQSANRGGGSCSLSGFGGGGGLENGGGETSSNDQPRQWHRRRISDMFQEHLEKVQGSEDMSELDKYLSEPNEKNSTSFNLLSWWETNSPRLPILSMMAKDVLAVPISTVASEFAFSMGGHVLDQFRSSLTPKIVQALICTQDWIRKHNEPFDLEEKLEDLEELEKEFVETTIDSSILEPESLE